VPFGTMQVNLSLTRVMPGEGDGRTDGRTLIKFTRPF